ncbi:hypothetical protein EV421DRAFT_1900940 [Armillaria borealis]|uniref:Uncharacterized protein n=1 Tax=Armillaria borealis TaxID=47425 RepID=A0AA39JTK4_9AGAR|nr:hypothetical protein EV421DRAFT_1900940 [Armillaria borealis]
MSDSRGYVGAIDGENCIHRESNPALSETRNDDDDITTSHRIFSAFFYLLPPSPSGTLSVSCVQSQLGAATVLCPAYRSQLGAAPVSRSPHRVICPTYIDAERPFTDIEISSAGCDARTLGDALGPANITTHIQCLAMELDTRDIPLTKALTHGAPSTSERDTPSTTSIIFDHIEKRDWRSLAVEVAFEVPFGQIFAIVSVVTLMYHITLYSLPYYIRLVSLPALPLSKLQRDVGVRYL